MWNEMVNANCSRESRSAVVSIGASCALAPQIRLGKIEQLVGPTAHHAGGGNDGKIADAAK
jgi:hypothetical protein